MLREELTSAGPGPRVEYRVTQWGAFVGCSNHKALVEFVPDHAGCTMTWNVRFACVPLVAQNFWAAVTNTFVGTAASNLEAVLKEPSVTVDAEDELEVPPEIALNAFFDFIWCQGGGFPGLVQIVSEGDAETRDGCTRRILPPGLLERIRCVSRAAGGGFVVSYTVDNPGFFTLYPVVSHSGTVKLLPGSMGRTRISWTVQFSPLPGCASWVESITGFVIRTLIANLRSHVSSQ